MSLFNAIKRQNMASILEMTLESRWSAFASTTASIRKAFGEEEYENDTMLILREEGGS